MRLARRNCVQLHWKLMKGGALLALGNVGEQLFSLLRNIILARLLTPHDFGAAVTLAIAISVVELMSDVGVEKFMISAPDGNQSQVQGTLHAFLIARGIVLGMIIFLFADVIALVFKIPEAAWAYRWVSLVPFIRGFTHLDTSRFQREMAYRPNIGVNLAASCGGLGVAVVLAYYLRSFEAMLWSQIAQATIAVIGSHLVAARTYSVKISNPILARLLTYGWPLMINGAIMFAADQGDRLLIGATFGVKDLANYAIATIVTFGAGLFVLKVTGALYLPILSEAHSEPEKLKRRYELTGLLSVLMSICLAVPLILFGERIIPILFGSTYELPRYLVAWLAIAAGATVLRSFLIAAALATGNTKVIMFANCFKFVGLRSGGSRPSSGLRLGRRCRVSGDWPDSHHGLFFLFCLRDVGCESLEWARLFFRFYHHLRRVTEHIIFLERNFANVIPCHVVWGGNPLRRFLLHPAFPLRPALR